MNYKKNLFSEMRMYVIGEEKGEVTDESLTKAITLNENVKSLGFTFTAKDIIRLAKTDLTNVFDEIKEYVGEVKAKPMYPNFPSQVMEIDEAVFRFHQMVHYFTTYGVKAITGESVSKGWLPEVTDTEKTVSDITLLEAKTLEIISEKDQYSIPFERIISKNERMTGKEEAIIKECLKHDVKIEGIKVPFKENLTSIFNIVMDSDISRESKVRMLSSVCQHTGDVWKCLKTFLGIKKWHFKTSEKRTIVTLFESYPIEDFEANLIITNKKAAEVIKILEFVSYNRYSKKDGHKKAVASLRNGELRSWQSEMHKRIAEHAPDVISFMGQRPGILLRSINWLLKEGYNWNDISKKLMINASSLSTKTIVNVLTEFSRKDDKHVHAMDVVRCLSDVLKAKIADMDVPFRGKKVYVDWQDIEPSRSNFSKSEEGGYVRSGIAIRLPEMGRYIRFFCYWNDEECIDIDLHAMGEDVNKNDVHVGWNSDFNTHGIVHSGDITHSNAAEYIDLDMKDSKLDSISFVIHSYTCQTFDKIDTVFTGLMAVSELGQKVDVKLYNPKNVIWSHELSSHETKIKYGTLDIQNKILILNGNQKGRAESSFTYKDYVDLLIEFTDAVIVDSYDEADYVLKPYKAESDKEISLLDENFFMDR